MSPEYVCPKCNSRNIKKMQVLDEEGHNKDNVMTIRGGSPAIGGNVNIGYSGGDIASKLAEKAIPPVKPLNRYIVIIGEVFFILVGIFLCFVYKYVKTGATIIILTVLTMWFTVKKELEDEQKTSSKLSKDVCLICGDISLKNINRN